MATTSPISHSPYLRIIAGLFGTIALGFGINGMIRPRNAFNVFEFPLPSSPRDQKVIDSLMIIYGVRDIFIAVAIYTTAWFDNKKSLGWILITMFGVAFTDGAVCKMMVGMGEWNHWGYAPVVGVAGALLLGVADGKVKGA